MARILYGVAGEGSGHASRAREILQYLIDNGHEVKVVTSGRGYDNLHPDFDIEKIFGFRFDYKRNEIKYIKTLFSNFIKTPENTKSINKVRKLAKTFQPQLILSDFEPISCLVANLKRLPLISIDNQHRLTNTEIDYPKKLEKDVIAAKALIRLFIYNAQVYLVTTFDKAKVKKEKTFLFPPILRQAIRDIEPKNEGRVLVYLTSGFTELAEILKEINEEFIVYGFDKSMQEQNIIFKKASQAGFLSDLAGSKAVIANAGFTLITEALYLSKPYLALPVKSQFEQVYNAYTLEKLGYGKYWEKLDKEKIESFLFNLELYRDKLKQYKREDNSKIFKKIDSLINKYTTI
jgi:uncharacterized protein (TIGR00661 family)